MKQLLIIMFMLAICTVSCFRKNDVKTTVVKVPELKTQNHAKLIQDAFIHEAGIRSIRPDFQRHEVTITYDSMIIAIKNIEFVIAGTGFDANDTPAKPEAVKKK